MNKQSQLTLSTQLNIDPKSISSASQHSSSEALKMLADQSLTARNIVISKHSVQMDVLINNAWQTLRLSTEQENPKTERFLSANIQLSNDGKGLTITPLPITITLGKSQQLQALLNLFTQGNANTNTPYPATIASNQPMLQLPSLKTEFALNNTLATLLKTEAPLKAILLPATNQQNSFNLNIINRFGDSLHQQSVSQQKVADLVAKLVPEIDLKLTGQQLQLSLATKQNSELTLPLAAIPPKQAKQIQAHWQFNPHTLKLLSQRVKETIELVNKAPIQHLLLKNSLSDTFTHALKSQPLDSKTTPLAPSSSNDSPIRSWLKDSFADLKTRISDAVRYFERLPATTKSTANLSVSQTPGASNSVSQVGYNAKQINIIKLASLDPNWSRLMTSNSPLKQQPGTLLPTINNNVQLAATKSAGEQPMLPVSFNKSAPLIQLFQQLKVSLEPLINTPAINDKAALISSAQIAEKPPTTSAANAINKVNSIPAQASNIATNIDNAVSKDNPALATKAIKQTVSGDQLQSLAGTKGAITEQTTNHLKVKAELPASITSQVSSLAPFLAAKEPNLRQPLLAIGPIEAALIAKLVPMPQSQKPTSTPLPVQLSEKLVALSEQSTSSSVDLNRLVNQAFNRMISSQNIHPATIERELLSILRPASLTPQNQQASFNQGLEQLAVTALAAPIINQAPTNLSFNNQTGLDALLQVLVPNFKAVNGSKLLEQLQQPNLQALAGELSQVKNTLTQVQTTPINQQQDSNPLAQFFLPMKLPAEAGQTEISLGQYKKPSKNKLESKNVWFVRLNFDYAQLGKLQVTAEVMDTAVDCQLLASSQEVTALAHPHLETLRHKLASHGLNVGELNLQQGTPSHQAFYKSHAIINIKV
ncbi:flagellar hook-length control protein FliK [Pseudoalteromonas sp. SYSU M81236]|jgi:hypothetical protein|uniref:flagellar hook-length control protein FliK n=1 Tax=Pseudoalteromonas sp. SYSU M81236 TaxID=3447014 RepID=UPI003F0BA130